MSLTGRLGEVSLGGAWRSFGHSGGSQSAYLDGADGGEAMISWSLRKRQVGLSTWGRRLGSNDPAEVLCPLRRLQVGLCTLGRRLGSNDPVEVL